MSRTHLHPLVFASALVSACYAPVDLSRPDSGILTGTLPCHPGETRPCAPDDLLDAGRAACPTAVRRCGPTGNWLAACEIPAEVCNLVDDDCDGLVDEGFEYLPVEQTRREHPSTHITHASDTTRLDDDHVVLTWNEGLGDAFEPDFLHLTWVDGDGADIPGHNVEVPIPAPGRPPQTHRLGDRLVTDVLIRDYVCAAQRGSTCGYRTLSVRLDASERTNLHETAAGILQVRPCVAAGDRLLAPELVGNAPHVFAFTPSGEEDPSFNARLDLDAEQFATLTGVAVDDQIHWFYRSAERRLRHMRTGLRANDPELSPEVAVPEDLDPESVIVAPSPPYAPSGRQLVLFAGARGTGAYRMVRFDLDGHLLGSPIEFGSGEYPHARVGHGQIYVVSISLGFAFFTRVSLDGRVLQRQTFVSPHELLAGQALIEPVRAGALVFVSDWQAGRIQSMRVTCGAR